MNTRLRSVAVMGLAGLAVLGCAGQPVAEGPRFVITTPVVELRAGSSVTMYGTGFAPKQEVNVVFKDPGGGYSGISSALKPEPVPNQDGAWAAVWDISPYIAAFTPGTGMLSVADKDWKTLAQVPIVLVAPPAKPKPEAAKPEAAKPEAAKPAAKPKPAP